MPSAAHRGHAVGRLQGADQHRARRTLLFADEIDAPMDAVGAIDVSEAGWAKHHSVARCGTPNRVRRRLGVMIGLDLDDDAADAVHQQGGADQVGRDLMHAASKESTFELFTGRGRGSVLGHSRWYAKTESRPRRAVAVLAPPD